MRRRQGCRPVGGERAAAATALVIAEDEDEGGGIQLGPNSDDGLQLAKWPGSQSNSALQAFENQIPYDTGTP